MSVRAHPNARRDEVRLVGPRLLEIWVRAAARDGRANDGIKRALGTALGIRPSAVQIVLGARGRDKVVAIDGIDDSDLKRLRVDHPD